MNGTSYIFDPKDPQTERDILKLVSESEARGNELSFIAATGHNEHGQIYARILIPQTLDIIEVTSSAFGSGAEARWAGMYQVVAFLLLRNVISLEEARDITDVADRELEEAKAKEQAEQKSK